MNTYGLTINHNKSTYTHNCNKTMEPMYAQGKEIPKIAKDESYLYLGIHINIDLNCEKHENNESQIPMETQTNKKQKTNNDPSSIYN